MQPVLNGIDIFLLNGDKTKRLGLLTNNAAVTRDYIASRKALLNHGYHLVKLFSPEHGLDTTGEDGHLMNSCTDTLTGLPVVSLYGDKLAPDDADLADIDLVLVDLPDIGSRFYTYLWTMTWVMESCARYDKPLIILDRPNPISGQLSLAEGPFLDEKFASSFIGRWEMPLRHSCTLGELALYFNATRNLNCPVDVVRCEGWTREMMFHDWAASFVPASPAISSFESALLYPGLCLLEATNLSEGRGTTVPFRVAGAPWMESRLIAEKFNSLEIENVRAREISFIPGAGKYGNLSCKGIMLHVNAPRSFYPVRTGLLLLKTIIDTHREEFHWETYKTHVNKSGEHHLDLLLGRRNSLRLFEADMSYFYDNIALLTDASRWESMVAAFLLYN
ncbi:exo-beta-N-acetylmuramidase NamZ family protein [Arcticibacter tournemirensis]